MIFFDEYEMSRWAFYEYKKGNNKQEIIDLIIDPYWVFEYCILHAIKNKEKIKYEIIK